MYRVDWTKKLASPTFHKGDGYWISPGNACFRLRGRHIEAVCANPGGFGIKPSSLHDLFRKYNEGYGVEANARVQVIRNLVLQGWIRVRHYPIRVGWFFNLPNGDSVTVVRVARFFLDVQTAGAYDDNLVLDSPAGKNCTVISEFLEASSQLLAQTPLPQLRWITGEEELIASEAPPIGL